MELDLDLAEVDVGRDPGWKVARVSVEKLADAVFEGRRDKETIVARLRKGGVSNLRHFRGKGAPHLMEMGIPEDACIALVRRGLLNPDDPRQNGWDGEAYVRRRQVSKAVFDSVMRMSSLDDAALQTVFTWMEGNEVEGETGKWRDPELDYANYSALIALITKLFPVKYRCVERFPGALDTYNFYDKYRFVWEERDANQRIIGSRLAFAMYAGGRCMYHEALGAHIKDMKAELTVSRWFAYGIVAAEELGWGHFMEFLKFRFLDAANPVSGHKEYMDHGVEMLIKMMCASPQDLGLV